MRQTSIAAYRHIEENGLLSSMRFRVYQYLFNNGPLTAGELTLALKGPNEVHPSYHRRLDELGALGVAQRVQIRPCRVTGHEVYEWDVTSELPRGKVEHAKQAPTLAEMYKAACEMVDIVEERVKSGRACSPELVKVCVWLINKSRSGGKAP